MKKIYWDYTPTPTGFLSEFIDTIDMYSYRDMPRHKLASAIAMLSPYASTKFRFGNFRPQLYLVSLAPSGLGKTRWTQFAKPFFEHKSFGVDFMGVEEFSSSVKFAERIGEQKTGLHILDEAGAFFRKIQSKNENAEVQVSQMLKKLYTIQGRWQGKPASGRSDASAGVTWEPCPVCWFLLQPEIFQSHAGYDSVVDGLFGRCIYFVETEWNPLRNSQPSNEAMLRSMSALAKNITDEFGAVDYKHNSNLGPHEVPRMSEYATRQLVLTPDAKNLLETIKHKFDETARDSRQTAEKALHGRAYDQLCRLTALVAAFDDLGKLSIRPHHVAFSATVVNDSIESILPLMIDASSVSRSDSAVQRVVRAVKDSGLIRQSVARRDYLRPETSHEKDNALKEITEEAYGIYSFGVCHSSKITKYLTTSKELCRKITMDNIGQDYSNPISVAELEQIASEVMHRDVNVNV